MLAQHRSINKFICKHRVLDNSSAFTIPGWLFDIASSSRFFLEDDDVDTIKAVETYKLPPFFRVVTVPNSYPKTKPKFVWIKGHNEHPQNERCDKLAVAAALKENLPPDLGFEVLKNTVKDALF